MLKLRAVLCFALTVVAVLAQAPAQHTTAFDGHSYSASGGSGDSTDAGDHQPTVPTASAPKPTKQKTATTSSQSSNTGSAGDDTIDFPSFVGTVPRWGKCDVDTICATDTYCNDLASGISLCYPN